MKVVALRGTHYEMGRAHGAAVRDRRPLLVAGMQSQLDSLAARPVDFSPRIREVLDIWSTQAVPTLDMLRGMADSLALDSESFLRYTLRSYLEDCLLAGGCGPQDGCTDWAAAAPATRDGLPLLVKNRDYRPAHLALQFLVRAAPARGYRYLYVTSAGSPGVYSSGMNERGLAVADTHIPSPDAGPGIARYSLMMDILEGHDRVASALDYLRQVPRLGHGSLILADVSGELAVAEIGRRALGIVEPANGTVVTTNHFVTAPLAGQWVDISPPATRGNSLARRHVVEHALAVAAGQIDVPFARALMARHGQPQDALCRHVEMDGRSSTISTAIFEPAARRLNYCHGTPCSAPFTIHMV